MSYDLEILVVGKCKIKSQKIGNIYIDTRQYTRRAYIDTFKYITEQTGTWCSIVEIDNYFFSAMNICDCYTNVDAEYPFWESDRVGMCVFKIRPEYEKSVINAFEYLLNESPSKKIIVLPRLQGGEHNNICGVIKLNKFIDLINKDKILFNLCYIIEP